MSSIAGVKAAARMLRYAGDLEAREVSRWSSSCKLAAGDRVSCQRWTGLWTGFGTGFGTG
jgi:hypothetical protein